MGQKLGNYTPNTDAKANISDVIKVNSQFSHPGHPHHHIGNIGGVKDIDSLMGMFGTAQSNQGGLMQSMQMVGKEQTAGSGQNQQITGMVKSSAKWSRPLALKSKDSKPKRCS